MSTTTDHSEFAQELPDSAPERDYRSWRFWLFDGDAAPWTAVGVNCVAILVPLLVLGLAFGTIAGIGAFMGAFPGALGARRSGPRWTLPVVALATAGGYLALQYAGWAPVVGAVLGLVAGFAGRHGASAPAVMAVLTWTISTGSIIPTDEALLVAAAQLGGLAWAVSVITVASDAGSQSDSKPSRAYAFVFGGLFAAGIAIATWVGQNVLTQHGFWFPLCVAILSLPPHTRYFTRAAKRVLGTLVGCGIAFVIGSLSPPSWAVAVIALVGFVATQRLIARSQLMGSAAITGAVILFISKDTPVRDLAVARLVDFAAGAGLAALLAACGVVFLHVVDEDALRALQQE